MNQLEKETPQSKGEPRTWCEYAGKPNCNSCQRGLYPRLCPNTPKPPAGISYRMDEVLTEIGPDWAERPVGASWPTLDALEKRGLIEVRGGRWKAETRRVVAAIAEMVQP